MRATFVSDTHGLHARLSIEPTDVLVHCGDFSIKGRKTELLRLLDWMAAQPATYRLLVLGNHDRYARERPAETLAACDEAGVVWLDGSGVRIDSVHWWGSARMPPFRARGTEATSDPERRAHWSTIPSDVDVLVTHVPPFGIGDRAFDGTPLGCVDLREAVLEKAPKIHVFGHIHEAHGAFREEGHRTAFYNAASLPLRSKEPRAPLVLDV